ncbi:hypothetical protein SAMN05444920_1602 [Nonomuraea solani]|uniref:Uncharacterized protein n=1 Tax=Nonomuraea solani TaxID=1144553 RepID=A0A1H6F4T6_9ACTN|nr:hypothetical protein [Nonomuraea solani]SEH04106.1 hypothetical protein SAMN05444920_1602 [Nonomuraea solani]
MDPYTDTDTAVICAPPGHVLSPAVIDEVLSRIGQATDAVAAQHAEALQADRDQAEELERLERRRDPVMIALDPSLSLCGVRRLLAEEVEQQLARMMLEFAAWWSDVAACAVITILTGTPLTLARVAAVSPRQEIPVGALDGIAVVPESERQLAELALFMDTDRPPGITAVGGQEFAQRLGLEPRYLDNGEVVLHNGDWPEARRRRMWGEAWLSHNTPLLPPWCVMARAMAVASVPEPSVTAILQATHAVDLALAASIHSRLLMEAAIEMDGAGQEQQAAQTEAQGIAWMKIGDEIPAVLIAYARTLTTHLPAVRRACAPAS